MIFMPFETFPNLSLEGLLFVPFLGNNSKNPTEIVTKCQIGPWYKNHSKKIYLTLFHSMRNLEWYRDHEDMLNIASVHNKSGASDVKISQIDNSTRFGALVLEDRD